MFKIIFLPKRGNGLFGRWWQFTLCHLFTWADCLAAVGLVIVSVSCLSALQSRGGGARWHAHARSSVPVRRRSAQSRVSPSSFLAGHEPIPSPTVLRLPSLAWRLDDSYPLISVSLVFSRVGWNWSRQQLLTLISDFRDTVRSFCSRWLLTYIKHNGTSLQLYYYNDGGLSFFVIESCVQTLLGRINWKLRSTYAQYLGSNVDITAVFPIQYGGHFYEENLTQTAQPAASSCSTPSHNRHNHRRCT